ncbi:MAG: phosphatidylglycerophosphatase A [Lentisphaerae bacterium]|nr:phosphatidylglycerophosphatase A [Lentisphaerota bacterium]
MKAPGEEYTSVTTRVAVWLATGFGLGYSPVASGTVGSLPGVLIVMALSGWSLKAQIVAAAVMTVVAIPICGRAEEFFGRKDDGRIVADEYLTFLICTLGLPWQAHPWMLAQAFVVTRILDIIKPPPARQSQSLAGGLGIVMDDLLSSLYALAANHGIWWGLQRWM